MPNDKSLQQVLLAMKESLTKGWIQGDFKQDDGFCLYGAVNEAADLHPRLTTIRAGTVRGRGSQMGPGSITRAYVLEDKPEALQAMQLIADAAGVDLLELALWNDAEGRTQEEVVALIDKALLTLEPAEEAQAQSEPATV